jgi:hypothetical protein
MKLSLIVWSLAVVFLANLFLPALGFSETAVYDATWKVPRCTSGISPCTVPASLINGRDNMTSGAEPHQPNTLSTSPCADGSYGTYHTNESLDAVTITDLKGSQFLPGDSVRLDATVWCPNSTSLDKLYIYQTDTPSLPNWNIIGIAACTALDQQVLSVTFKLGAAPSQAIRAAFTYLSPASPCASGTQNDRDDVLITVMMPLDSDGDGMPDSYENAHPCLNANVADGNLDPDGDGMTSLQEYTYSTSLDPCLADTDGDAFPDGWEAQYQTCGFDPLADWGQVPCKIGSDVRISSLAWDNLYPSLVWAGSEFGAMWANYDYPRVYFNRVSLAGAKIGSDLLVSDHGVDLEYGPGPSMIWSGSEFGLSWTNGLDVFFARLSRTGAKIGSDLTVYTKWPSIVPNWSPSLAWTGSEYGVSWCGKVSLSSQIFFVRVSAAGAKLGSEIYFPGGMLDLNVYPSLVWTGSEFGVAWARNTESVYFVRISQTGAKIGSEILVASTSGPGYSAFPSLVWTGSQFGVSWTDKRDGNFETYFARLSATGAKLGSDLRVTNNPADSGFSSLAWTGSEFGLSWSDNRDGNGETYFARISAAGAKIGGELRVTRAPLDSVAPALAWTGSEYGVSWHDYRDGNASIYFSRICGGIEYTDKDRDGLPDSQEYARGTNPCIADTDGDGLSDGYEVNTSHTNPLVADSDGDGLGDGYEVNTSHTNPLNWDSDGDRLPDGFEVANGGHAGGGLDPINALDAAADFDGDGNSNVNEFYNGSDPWTKDPVPGVYANPGCYYWADGDGDGNPAPSDIVMLKLQIAGVGQEYREILPHGTDTLDLDRDGHAASSDLVLLKLMVAGSEQPGGYPSQALSLEVVDAPSGSVAQGTTTHVTVSVHSVSGDPAYAPGFGVVFEVVSGNGVLLGGDGTANGEAEGNRYDFSMEAAAGARAKMVVLVTGPGAVTIGAKIPGCGAKPLGRWNDEVVLNPAVVFNDN